MARGINATIMVNKMCFILALPINNNSNEVAPTSNAVERFAGAINPHTKITGNIRGRYPFLKSLITSCFLLIVLARYINKASFARSEVWKVWLIIGTLIQREPSFSLTPKNKVYISRGTAITISIFAHLE